jgi:hypothetical protein
MFRFHLVPHVFGELCLQGQNSQKGGKASLLEAIHMAKRGMAHKRVPYHITDPWEGGLEHCGALIQGRFTQWQRFTSPGSKGPLSYKEEAPTDLSTDLQWNSWHVLSFPPPLRAI